MLIVSCNVGYWESVLKGDNVIGMREGSLRSRSIICHGALHFIIRLSSPHL